MSRDVPTPCEALGAPREDWCEPCGIAVAIREQRQWNEEHGHGTA
jgi:hypothetical protein